jgi:hypothetical protein
MDTTLAYTRRAQDLRFETAAAGSWGRRERLRIGGMRRSLKHGTAGCARGGEEREWKVDTAFNVLKKNVIYYFRKYT